MTMRGAERTTNVARISDPCTIVIFGATGDLTRRKLVPALYNLRREGLLHANTTILGFARRDWSDDYFRSLLFDEGSKHSRTGMSDTLWPDFAGRIHYVRSTFEDATGYMELAQRLAEIDEAHGTSGNRLFYLATPLNHTRTSSNSWVQLGWHSHVAGPASSSKNRSVMTSTVRATSTTCSTMFLMSAKSTALTTIWAKKQCKICWCFVLRMGFLSHCGIVAILTMCKSPSPRASASRAVVATTSRRVPCVTWCKIT